MRGAQSVVLDVLDPQAVRETVRASKPDAIVYQATALAGVRVMRSLDKAFAGANRLRTVGIDNVIAAAREVGVERLVAQTSLRTATPARAAGSRMGITRSSRLRPLRPAGLSPR